jgi:hypothetical protein
MKKQRTMRQRGQRMREGPKTPQRPQQPRRRQQQSPTWTAVVRVQQEPPVWVRVHWQPERARWQLPQVPHLH